MTTGRRGASLVELMVALSLLALLAGVALRILLVLSRQAVAVSEHAAVQGGVRTGLLMAQAELRGLGGDPASADLVRISPDSLVYRAARGFGVTCELAATQVRILNDRPLPFSALRAIVPGRDSLLLFVEGDSTSTLDDSWIRLPVISVGPSTCAGRAAIAVGTADLSALVSSGALEAGGPVRIFEVMRIAEYSSAGLRWLGTASVSGGESIQPIAGPLFGNGLTITYLDDAGATVSDPMRVRTLQIALAGASERNVARGWTGRQDAVAIESTSVRLQLRNVGR